MENEYLNKSNKVRTASYCRVSTFLGQTFDGQIVPIREFCKSQGYSLFPENEYSDLGYSGAKDRRPGLDQLLRDARAGKFKVLVVAALDRVGRNVKHLLLLLDELNALGITFVSLRESINLGTPVGRMIMTVLASIAELEREVTRQRIKETMAAKKLLAQQTGNGWRCGRPSTVTPEIIQQVLEFRSQGRSVRQIEQLLGRRISHSTIGKIVKDNGLKQSNGL